MAALATIRTWITNRLPTGYFGTILTSTELTNLINEAQKEVCRVHNFAWMKRETTQSTVNGQQRYDLPDGATDDGNGVRVWRFKQDISCELVDHDGQRVPLTCALKNDLENDGSFADTSDSGIPSHYTIDSFDLWLFLPPDHGDNNNEAWTINLEYFGYLPELSESLTTNFLTDHCDDLLKFGGLALAFELGHDHDEADYWRDKFKEVLGELIEEDLNSVHGPIETGLTPLTKDALGAGGQRADVETMGGYVDE
jgi:hypothetical protein